MASSSQSGVFASFGAKDAGSGPALSPKDLALIKMQTLGNDFVLIDGRHGLGVEHAVLAELLCDRRFGVGGDGLLVMQPSKVAEFRIDFFNPNGSSAICLNATACLAKHIYDSRLIPGETKQFELETVRGPMRVRILAGGSLVRLSAGAPIFESHLIPCAASGECVNEALLLAGERYSMNAVGMGNPHCILPVDDVDKIDIEALGPQLEHHPLFPEKTNVEFVQVLNRGHVRMRIWERGVGETLSCGSGQCAAVAALIRLELVDRHVRVSVPGGEAEVAWPEGEGTMLLSTSPRRVFRGVVNLQELMGDS